MGRDRLIAWLVVGLALASLVAAPIVHVSLRATEGFAHSFYVSSILHWRCSESRFESLFAQYMTAVIKLSVIGIAEASRRHVGEIWGLPEFLAALLVLKTTYVLVAFDITTYTHDLVASLGMIAIFAVIGFRLARIRRHGEFALGDAIGVAVAVAFGIFSAVTFAVSEFWDATTWLFGFSEIFLLGSAFVLLESTEVRAHAKGSARRKPRRTVPEEPFP